MCDIGIKYLTSVMQSHIQPVSPPQSTRSLLLGIWRHLCRRRRLQLGVDLLLMLASGISELMSLGAVLPFLGVLSNPEQLWQQPFIKELASKYGLSQANQLIIPATAAFALAAIVAAVIRLANLWFNGKLAAAVGSDLSFEAYKRTLYQPFGVHMQRNSSVVMQTLTTQVNRSVIALTSLLQMLTAIVVAVGLLTGLLLIDWKVALATAALFAIAYSVIAKFTKRELSRNSSKIVETSRLVLKAVQEGLGAIRDVLLDSSQATYLVIYGRADRPQRQLETKNQYLSAFPRFALEAVGLVAIALLGGFLVLHRGGSSGVIPLLGALGLGAQRLLPALQLIYSSWANLKGFNADLSGVLLLLEQPLPANLGTRVPLAFSQSICLNSIHFRYGRDLPEVLQGLDLQINCGERIGLIGCTGSGKSTLADLLMGLLVPSAGRLLVDGLDLHELGHPERLAAWRAAVAHVPQSIYLADSSIAENIAFGLPRHDINLERVKLAAEQAQIASFIESIPDGYLSFVGERGIRLSGGQRQRIGIARALYKQARVIVLDEATSALDARTEQAVMDAVDCFSRDLTILMIAHRLSTMEYCDRVVRLRDGVVIASGPPKEILSAKD